MNSVKSEARTTVPAEAGDMQQAAPPLVKTNLITEFKHAFQDIWSPLVNENQVLFGSNSLEESRLTLENSVTRYIDIARQLETWFAQRRVVLKTPEQDLEDEIQDLKQELERKEILIRAVHDRSHRWSTELKKMIPSLQEEQTRSKSSDDKS